MTKHIEPAQLSLSATARDIRMAIGMAQPGQAFKFELGDGRAAILACVTLLSDEGRPAGDTPDASARSLQWPATGISKLKSKQLGREACFVEITKRLQSGRARSPHAAAMQITRGNFNGAHYLGKLYRKRFCLPASAFSQKNELISKDLSATTCDSIVEPESTKDTRMAVQEEKALAPDKLKRVIPRLWRIDLDVEGLADATHEEILDPGFWQEGAGKVDFGDVVTLTRANAPALNILIGVEHPEGGFFVHDITGSLSGPATP